jgi:hypothetical protein
MPKIIITILRLLPEKTGFGKLKNMSLESITAESSVAGEQNIKHVRCYIPSVIVEIRYAGVDRAAGY